MSNAPAVADALALVKVNTPFTVIPPPAVLAFVPAPLMVRLLYVVAINV
jgi:hypothetical protein